MDGVWKYLFHSDVAEPSRYPYPIFEQVPFEGRVGLFVLSAVVMAFSTATLKWLHGRVNGYGTAAAAQSRPGAVKQNGVL